MAQGPESQPVTLSPPGKWVVQFDDEACTASRSFGDGDDRFAIVLRPSLIDERLGIDLIARPKAPQIPDTGEATLTLAPTGVVKTVRVRRLTGVDRYRIAKLSLARGYLSDLAKASSLSMKDDAGDIKVDLPSAAALVAALGNCETTLLQHWGVDPDHFRALPRAHLDPATARLVMGDNYPTEAFRLRQEGMVLTLLSIDSQGHVTDCKTIVSSSSPSLDRATCKLNVRSRYIPGEDANGKPADSVAFGRMRWVIPKQ